MQPPILNLFPFMGAINYQYLKLQVEFRNILKVASSIHSIMLNSKILIVSGATIRVIFQNSVTYVGDEITMCSQPVFFHIHH